MRISDGSTPGPIDSADSKVGGASSAQAPGSKTGAVQATTGGADTVNFGLGQNLLQLAVQLSAVSRQSRINELRERLVTGDYQISSNEISRAIVEDIVSRGFPRTL